MTRYFYYFVIMCMLTNTVFFVPSVLIENRYNGSVMSILLSIVSGTLFTVLFVKSIGRFPKQGIPEIFRQYLPGWIRNPYLVFLALLWFAAGGIVLLNYSRLLQRFINPDINLLILVGFFALVCSWIASGSSRSVMYLTEMVLVLHIPLIALILFKALTNQNLDYDAIRVVIHYTNKLPNWMSMFVASYVFSGYMNMMIYNRVFGKEDKIKFLWAVPVIGSAVLLTTFFIPIGLHGADGVSQYIFIWQSTADSIRMEFGFVERVLFVYLLLYLSISLVFVCMSWHIGSELVKGLFITKRPDPDMTYMRVLSWCLFGAVAVLLLFAARKLDDKQFLQISKIWFMIRYPSELSLVALMVWLGMRKRA